MTRKYVVGVDLAKPGADQTVISITPNPKRRDVMLHSFPTNGYLERINKDLSNVMSCYEKGVPFDVAKQHNFNFEEINTFVDPRKCLQQQTEKSNYTAWYWFWITLICAPIVVSLMEAALERIGKLLFR